MPNTKSEIRGCIDLGSSYFRLLVARCRFPGGRIPPDTSDCGGAGRSHPNGPEAPGRFDVVAEERIYVGWGEAVAGNGLLPDPSIERAVGALRLLASKAAAVRCTDPLVLGTNTLRTARNGKAALRTLREAVGGMPITVLTQRQEADLSYRGACTVLDRPKKSVMIDLGGTSTEIAWGNGCVMEDCRGIPCGTHAARKLSLRCGPRRSFLTLRELVIARLSSEEMNPLYVLPTAGEIPTILATGGTAVSLAAVMRCMRGEMPLVPERTPVSADDFRLAARRLWALFLEGHERRLPLEQERTALLMPGLILLAAVMHAMDIRGFIVTPRDLRWGGMMSGKKFAQHTTDGGRHR